MVMSDVGDDAGRNTGHLTRLCHWNQACCIAEVADRVQRCCLHLSWAPLAGLAWMSLCCRHVDGPAEKEEDLRPSWLGLSRPQSST